MVASAEVDGRVITESAAVRVLPAAEPTPEPTESEPSPEPSESETEPSPAPSEDAEPTLPNTGGPAPAAAAIGLLLTMGGAIIAGLRRRG